MAIYADQGTLPKAFPSIYENGSQPQLNVPEEDAISTTGEQLSTIGNRISDIRGVTDSLFGKLSPILVQTPREATAVKEPKASVPTKLGQSLNEIIDQLGSVLDYLRDLHETIRL